MISLYEKHYFSNSKLYNINQSGNKVISEGVRNSDFSGPCASKMLGGYIGESKVSKLIDQINKKNGLHAHTLTKGAGCILLGTTTKDSNEVRVLCGVTTDNKISSFGGNCNQGENSLHCTIRETIEELFYIKPSQFEMHAIETYLNTNPEKKYIFYGHTYIFDISILGNIITEMVKVNPSPWNQYLYDNYVNTGHFSPPGPSVDYTSLIIKGKHGHTFDIHKFMKKRDVFYSTFQAIMGSSLAPKEIDWLSFPTLNNLLMNNAGYNIYSEITHNRSYRPYRGIFAKAIKEINTNYPEFFS